MSRRILISVGKRWSHVNKGCGLYRGVSQQCPGVTLPPFLSLIGKKGKSFNSIFKDDREPKRGAALCPTTLTSHYSETHSFIRLALTIGSRFIFFPLQAYRLINTGLFHSRSWSRQRLYEPGRGSACGWRALVLLQDNYLTWRHKLGQLSFFPHPEELWKIVGRVRGHNHAEWKIIIM